MKQNHGDARSAFRIRKVRLLGLNNFSAVVECFIIFNCDFNLINFPNAYNVFVSTHPEGSRSKQLKETDALCYRNQYQPLHGNISKQSSSGEVVYDLFVFPCHTSCRFAC